MSSSRVQEQLLRARSLIAAKEAILNGNSLEKSPTEMLQNCNEVFANARKLNEVKPPVSNIKKPVRLTSSKLAPIPREEMQLPTPKAAASNGFEDSKDESKTSKPVKYAGPSSLNTVQGELKKALIRTTRPVASSDMQKSSVTSWKKGSSHNKPIAPPTEEPEGIRPNMNMRRVGSMAATPSASVSETFSMNSSKMTIPTIIDPNIPGNHHVWPQESTTEKELNALMRYKKLEEPTALPVPVKKEVTKGPNMLLTAQAPSIVSGDDNVSVIQDNVSISDIPKFKPYEPGMIPVDPADDLADPNDLLARLDRLRVIAERLANQFNGSQMDENSSSPSTNMSLGVHFSQTHVSRNTSSILRQSKQPADPDTNSNSNPNNGPDRAASMTTSSVLTHHTKAFKVTTQRKQDKSMRQSTAESYQYTDSELGLDPDLMHFERTPTELTTGALKKCEEFRNKLKAAKERLFVVQHMKMEGFEVLPGEEQYMIDDAIDEVPEDEEYMGDYNSEYPGGFNNQTGDDSWNYDNEVAQHARSSQYGTGEYKTLTAEQIKFS